MMETCLHATEYNAVRIINRLAQLVEEAGGSVADMNEEVAVRTGGYDQALEQKAQEQEQLEQEIGRLSRYSAKKVKMRRRATRMAQEAEAIRKARDSAPVVRTRFMEATMDYWIRFSLNGYEYNFLTDGTPFMPDMCSKKPVGSEERVCMERIYSGSKFYYPDEVMMPVMPQDAVERSARGLFSFLMAQGESRRYA